MLLAALMALLLLPAVGMAAGAAPAGDRSEVDFDRPFRPCTILEPEAQPEGAWQANLWPGGVVPYRFNANVTSANAAQIRRSMDLLQTVCNVTFVPATTQSNYIAIQDSTGNSSFVGMVGGAQAVKIFNWGATYVMCHELMHALGLEHEQSRPDRDQYVIINYENVAAGQRSNFDIRGSSVAVGPYDFDSVMHYGSCFFSSCACSATCRTITVRPQYASQQNVIGQQTHLSTGDVAGLVSRYGTPGDDAFEPNDTPEAAKPIALGTALSLKLIDNDDYFSFQLPIAGVVTVAGSAGTWAGGNAGIEIRTPSGALYTASSFTSVSATATGCSLVATLPAGTWLVHVTRSTAWGGAYSLEVRPGFTTCGGLGALGAGANAEVRAMLTLPNGDVIVGGDFTSIAGRGANRIARLNAAALAATALGTGINGPVRAVAALANGSIVVGGSFTRAGTVAARNVALWNGVAWSALGGGLDGTVAALAVLPSGEVVAAGSFGSAAGTPASNVARWSVTGQSWAALGSGIGGPVNALAVLPNGDVVAGGSFTSAGAIVANRVARWNGANWAAMGSGMNDEVKALIVRTTGDLIAGGSFSAAGGTSADRIARWTGSGWLPLGTRLATPVSALVALPGGDFAAAGGGLDGNAATNFITRWNNGSMGWSALGGGLNGEVLALAAQPSGVVVAGGGFARAGAVGAAGVARWTAPGPMLTARPGAAAVCVGSAATFTVSAAGDGLRYQWRKGDLELRGATGATLQLASVSADDAGTYFVAVANSCGGTTVASAVLTVRASTVIVTQPTALVRCAGSAAVFSVAATGATPLAYQWRKDGVDIAGARSASYTVAAPVAASAGSYSVVVAGPCGSLTSQPATLTVTPRTAIVSQPVALSRCLGTAASFGVVATGTGPIGYQWKRNGVNIGGATASEYSIAAVDAVSAGSYSVTVTGPCGAVSSAAARLVVTLPPTITVQPVGLTRCVGSAASFSVTATGTAPLVYQWRKDGVVIAGAVGRTLNLGAAATAAAGSYDVVVSNGCATVLSRAAFLVVNTPLAVTMQPTGLSRCTGSAASFEVAATGSGPVRYQWKRNGVNIAGATGSGYVIPSVAAASAGSYTVAVTNPCGTVTSSAAVLAVTAAPVISVQPVGLVRCAGVPAAFSVTATGTAPLSYQWRLNGEPISGQNARTLSVVSPTVASAGVYDVVVSNGCGSVVSSGAGLAVPIPVVIAVQPTGVVGCIGGPAGFTVGTNAGSGVLRYQWRKNNANIAGATGASFTIAHLTAGSAGAYSVVVTGPCGPAATSVAAVLTVATCGVEAGVEKQEPCSLADIAGASGDGGEGAAGDGVLDGEDFAVFFDAFGRGDGRADLVGAGGVPPGDGVVDGDDLLAFINAFTAGC